MIPMNYKDEMYLAMLERTVRRLWILSLVSILLLVATNIAWIYYENQFEDSTTSIEATTDSGNFLLSGVVKRKSCGCMPNSANYLVDFGANIAIPTGGTVGAISSFR